MRILSSELSQLKRIAIINVICNCVCLTPLPIFLSDSKIDKKGSSFPSCRHKSQLIKKGTLFHLLQTNVIAR